jgi:phage terminase large subunit-like protein
VRDRRFASRDQATILYDQAGGFVRRSPGLQRARRRQARLPRARALAHFGGIRVLAADVDTADGVIPTLALVDELHRHKSAATVRRLPRRARPRDGQMLTISTAGDNEQSRARADAHERASVCPATTRRRYTYAHSSTARSRCTSGRSKSDDDVDDIALVKQANPLRAGRRSSRSRRRTTRRRCCPGSGRASRAASG